MMTVLKMTKRAGRRFFAAAALCLVLSGCKRAESTEASKEEPERFLLTMETFTDGSAMDLAGEAAAAVINNTVPGAHVQVSVSKGSPVNAVNVENGSVDLALVQADTAWEAYYGKGAFEGEPKERLRVLAACYPVLSAWTAKKDSGLTWVHDLKGKTAGAGTEGSITDQMSRLAFSVMGISEENTALEPLGLEEGAEWTAEGWVQAAHSFAQVPNPGIPGADASGAEWIFLSYTEEELEAILNAAPWLYRGQLPAGILAGQEEAADTFGMKILLCASADMEEELAYEIAMAMDVNGPVYAGGHAFMSAMLEEEFLCQDLPIPLHDGARRYYEECGYLMEEQEGTAK